MVQSFILLNLLLVLLHQTDSSFMKFSLTSSAFENGSSIPSIYSRCDGKNISPPLEWTGVPTGTESLALIVEDPDAPDPKAPKMTWTHWILYNLSPTTTSLAKGTTISSLPAGTKEANNDWKVKGYDGPSPPIGTHRYFFNLYALDTILPDLGPAANRATVLEAMDGHVIGKAELMGTYKKGGSENDS